MAVKFSREEMFKKYGAENSGSSNNNGSSRTGSSNNSSNTSIWDRYEQNELFANNGTEAAKKLSAYERLFGRSINDGAYKVGALINNDDWRVDMDINGDGTIEQGISIADAIALSCDSELDLYIQHELENIIEKYGPECNYNLRAMFGSKESPAYKELLKLGIRADAVGDDEAWQNRTYAFSLVDTSSISTETKDRLAELEAKGNLTAEEQEELDAIYEEYESVIYSEDAKILEDEFGGKGSFIFSDCLIPDGTANGAEINLASILDTMGYECISKADFVDNPDEYFALMEEIGTNLENNQYTGSSTATDIYSENILDMQTAVRAVYTANGHAYGNYEDGYWGNTDIVTFEENLARIEKFGLGTDPGTISTIRSGNEEFKFTETEETAANGKIYEQNPLKYEKILKEKIEEYKEEHNGEEPPIEEYKKLVEEAAKEAK